MGAAILDQDGLSDWLAFGPLKLSQEGTQGRKIVLLLWDGIAD
jgi:hypothetical protein